MGKKQTEPMRPKTLPKFKKLRDPIKTKRSGTRLRKNKRILW